MKKSSLHLIERIVAQPDQIDQLKGWLQRAAEETRQVAGVQQLELFQNGQNPAEFIFFLIVDDLKQVMDVLNQAEWHQQLVEALPGLLAASIERVVGPKIG